MPGEVDEAVDVGRADLLPLVGRVGELAAGEGRGVVDHDVELAEPLDDRGDQGRGVGGVADVADDGQRAVGGLALEGLDELALGAARDRDVGAVVEERPGDRQADAAAAARDEDRLAG